MLIPPDVYKRQRFMNVLFKKYSTMTQEKVFSDTFSTTALAVYDEFESAEALAYICLLYTSRCV